MTVHLMEHYLGVVAPARIREEIFQGHLTQHARKKAATAPFLVNQEGLRIGLPWQDAELSWTQKALRAGTSLEDIARQIGRTARTVAKLAQHYGLLSEDLAEKYQLQQAA
jgi:predicted ATPase with chaperone activity